MKHFSINRQAVSFAARVILGCIIVWGSLDYVHDPKKVWALISVIVVSDPNFSAVRVNAISRLINTVLGCILGLIFIYFFGTVFWGMMLAVAVSVIISTSFKNYPSSWKLAPVTVVIVMIPYSTEGEKWKQAMDVALTRSGEVLYGTLIAFLLGFIYLKAEEIFRKKTEPDDDDTFEKSKDVHE